MLGNLANFQLPPDWQRVIVEEAARSHSPEYDAAQRRRQLEGRLNRIKELYAWGDLTRDGYLAERERVERELTRLAPDEEPRGEQLERLAEYVQSLPAAWADADQEQRTRLANLIYEELWVDGPQLLYVKPRPDVEQRFQVRPGRHSQPLPRHANCHR